MDSMRSLVGNFLLKSGWPFSFRERIEETWRGLCCVFLGKCDETSEELRESISLNTEFWLFTATLSQVLSYS